MGRRTETTEYLKNCIADALIELMRKKPLAKIKAQDITDLAKVGRVTYFRHFHSHSDVLEYKLLRLWKQWEEKRPVPGNDSVYDYAVWFFSFCASISDLLCLLYEQSQYMSMINSYMMFTAPIAEETEAMTRYKRMFFSYGIHGIVLEWIKSGFRETPEEFAAMCAESSVSK
ncbi:MAG: TetR/AcrR family transcriptional regulator [Oscillibacter sp.]|nr:TetR/AcrR family transcriptional regulator [Oscillospiraceae bacterium]MBR0280771.1 TetR/AcrR family transcriptional regulator [Oscillibacter sp.]